MQGKELLLSLPLILIIVLVVKYVRKSRERTRQHYRNEGRLQEIDKQKKNPLD